MLSHEERVSEVKRRIAKIEREKRLRRNTIAMAARIGTGGYSGFETTASMYGGSAALGYIVIGLLAFLLGVCVTILCFRLRQMDREDKQDKESEERHGTD